LRFHSGERDLLGREVAWREAPGTGEEDVTLPVWHVSLTSTRVQHLSDLQLRHDHRGLVLPVGPRSSTFSAIGCLIMQKNACNEKEEHGYE